MSESAGENPMEAIVGGVSKMFGDLFGGVLEFFAFKGMSMLVEAGASLFGGQSQDGGK